MVSKSVGNVPDMISAPSPVALGGRIEQIRNRALVHRADQTERRRVRDSKVILPAPSKAGAYRKQTVQPTMFPTRYSRGELPCAIEHRVRWGCSRGTQHSSFSSALSPSPRVQATRCHVCVRCTTSTTSTTCPSFSMRPAARKIRTNSWRARCEKSAAKQRSFSSLALLARCPGSARIARGIARLPRAHLALGISELDLAVETGAHDEECGTSSLPHCIASRSW